jgi:hypothetical protein
MLKNNIAVDPIELALWDAQTELDVSDLLLFGAARGALDHVRGNIDPDDMSAVLRHDQRQTSQAASEIQSLAEGRQSAYAMQMAQHEFDILLAGCKKFCLGGPIKASRLVLIMGENSIERVRRA